MSYFTVGCILSRAHWWGQVELAGGVDLFSNAVSRGSWGPSWAPPPTDWFVSHDGELLAFVHPTQPDRRELYRAGQGVRVLYRHRERSPAWRESTA